MKYYSCIIKNLNTLFFNQLNNPDFLKFIVSLLEIYGTKLTGNIASQELSYSVNFMFNRNIK